MKFEFCTSYNLFVIHIFYVFFLFPFSVVLRGSNKVQEARYWYRWCLALAETVDEDITKFGFSPEAPDACLELLFYNFMLGHFGKLSFHSF